MAAQKHPLWLDFGFGQLHDLIAYLRNATDVVNRKTALQTTITRAQVKLIKWTLVHIRRKIR